MGQLRQIDETTESHARLRQLNVLAELVPVGILALDQHLQCVFVNARWCDLSGLNFEESWQDDWLDAILHDDRDRFVSGLVEAAEQARGLAIDVRLRTPLGRVTWVKFESRAQFDYRDNFDGFVATVTDVSDHIETQQELHDRANYDLLSRLPNRSFFEDQLTEALMHSSDEHGIGLLFIDLDDFKDVNDTLGHDSGDEVIRIAAQRMRGVVRAGDVVARLGGDEFAILLRDIERAVDAGMVADKVVAALTETIRLRDERVQIGASVGIAIATDSAITPELLMKLADRAMYHAKRLGKNRYRFASGTLPNDFSDNADIRADLRQAVREEEFELYYQPQFGTIGGEIWGCEALLRWSRHDGRAVSPAEFIPLLDQMNLMESVTAWVTRTACAQLAPLAA